MAEERFRKYYVEWWKIRKSTIWGLVALVVLSSVLIFGGWWALRNDWFAPRDPSEVPPGAARIISFEGDVRITRAATRETIIVSRETFAAAGDTIQTQTDGKAVLQMVDGSEYTVRPNSSVVIRDNSSLFGGQNIRVALDDGQLNVRTEQQGENSQNVVEMLDSQTRLRPETDASFNADPRSRGGEIRISRGSVETTVGAQSTVITENEFAALSGGKLGAKEKLLTPPQLTAPANASQLTDPAGAGVTVTFNWQDSSSIAVLNYHLQVSRSSFFASDAILVDRGGLTSRDFRLAGMQPGTYYWRLKSTARSGQASDWSEPGRFSVVRGESSALIEVTEWNVERVGGTVHLVSGVTRPGLLVRTQGREVFAARDGTFRLQVSTPQAEVALEFLDDRGNRAGFVISLRNAAVVRRF
ncbi:MAG: FecR domain-containing protein [Blastocatellia bacterium]|nr:FecR domain-containing protein [Blastocatellia bacterium]